MARVRASVGRRKEGGVACIVVAIGDARGNRVQQLLHIHHRGISLSVLRSSIKLDVRADPYPAD
ncbi:hypothetical protein AK973_3287 [Pseudomonas brassicacearum]|nr:hypothetical protein AK973_3287 [Pseudomonas brassicacearum]